MDRISSDRRSAVMSKIRGSDTTPELLVRKNIFALGYRYRLHVKDLPGKPDIVMPRHRTVVFVHGCYWHRHKCKKGQSMPTTNTDFWKNKFKRNVERDLENENALKEQNWNTVKIWECETKDENKLVSILQERLPKK